MLRRALFGGVLVLGSVAGATALIAACADDRATFAADDEAGPPVVLLDASTPEDAEAADALIVRPDIGTDIACDSGTCIASLAVGRAHACSRTPDGAVYCWGTDELGQLGRGSRTDGGKDAPIIDCVGDAGAATVGPFRDAGVTPPFSATPARVDAHADRLGASADTTCIVTSTKTVECWGADQATYAADVTGLLRSANAVPRRVGCLPPVADVAVGTLTSCAVLLDGSLRCWGTFALENLGALFPDCVNNEPFGAYCKPAPFSLNDQLTFGSLVQRGGAFLALTKSGDLTSWGQTSVYYTEADHPGSQFPLSLTGRLTSFATRDVVELPKVTSMSLGLQHACAVSDGRTFCWGINGSGVIGRNSSAGKRIYPTPVEALLPPDARATSVSVNDHNTCARVADGRVFCWGDNAFGQLGTTAVGAESPVPVVVEGLPGLAVDVAVMVDSACALLKNGSVACWGSHAAGQLGDPTLAVGSGAHAVPVAVRF